MPDYVVVSPVLVQRPDYQAVSLRSSILLVLEHLNDPLSVIDRDDLESTVSRETIDVSDNHRLRALHRA